MGTSNNGLEHVVLKKNSFPTVLIILAFIFFILSLVIVNETPPANGYEISIYGAYPWYFWIFFIGAIFLATIVFIYEIFSEKKTNRWILSFFVILLGNFVFILLPLLRGYCSIGSASADVFTHIGWIKEILQVGHISRDNFYPIIHIFIISISDLLDVPVTAVVQFTPAFFWILYPPFMLLMARSITKNNRQAMFIAAFSFPLLFSIFQVTIHPSFLSFIFLPLLLFAHHRRNSSERKIEMTILIIILCFLIVFFHPMTTLITVVIFSIFIVLNIIGNKKNYTAITILLILLLSFFTWYSSHGAGQHALYSIYKNLFYGSDFTAATHYLSTLSMVNLSVFQSIMLFGLRYGAIIIYSFIAFLCFVIVGKKIVFSRKIKDMEFLYSMQLVAGFITVGAMTFGNFIATNPIRTSRYFLMIATVLIGLIIYPLSKKYQKQKRRFTKYFSLSLITILLFFSSAVCIFNVFPAPVNWQPNSQFTHMNFDGSAWVVKNRDLTIQTSGDCGFNLMRMEHYINGISKGNMRIKNENLLTQTHFGYDMDNTTLLQIFNYSSTYMITTENGRQAVYAFPKNVQQIATQFTIDDFNRLNSDSTTIRVYDNRELECWLIYGD